MSWLRSRPSSGAKLVSSTDVVLDVEKKKKKKKKNVFIEEDTDLQDIQSTDDADVVMDTEVLTLISRMIPTQLNSTPVLYPSRRLPLQMKKTSLGGCARGFDSL